MGADMSLQQKQCFTYLSGKTQGHNNYQIMSN